MFSRARKSNVPRLKESVVACEDWVHALAVSSTLPIAACQCTMEPSARPGTVAKNFKSLGWLSVQKVRVKLMTERSLAPKPVFFE